MQLVHHIDPAPRVGGERCVARAETVGIRLAQERASAQVDLRDELFVGGHFQSAGGVAANNIARFDGKSWAALGTGCDREVRALAVFSGALYVGGQFDNCGANPAHGISRWDGEAWSTLAEGMSDSILSETKAVNTLRVDANGPELTFAINGRPAVALRDSAYPAGDFGFVVETFDGTLAHIHFDSLVARRFNPENVPAAPTLGPTPEPDTATPTETATPTPTRPRGTPVPPVNLLTSVARTATALAGTAPALQTAVPPILTAIPTGACGLPGLPPCP